MQELGCDFYAFSAHKMYGPTGLGLLYVKYKWLEAFDPFIGGGGMIDFVSKDDVAYAKGFGNLKLEPCQLQKSWL